LRWSEGVGAFNFVLGIFQGLNAPADSIPRLRGTTGDDHQVLGPGGRRIVIRSYFHLSFRGPKGRGIAFPPKKRLAPSSARRIPDERTPPLEGQGLPKVESRFLGRRLRVGSQRDRSGLPQSGKGLAYRDFVKAFTNRSAGSADFR
jgi:hypothetical protein